MEDVQPIFRIKPVSWIIAVTLFLITIQELVSARLALTPVGAELGKAFIFLKEFLIIATAVIVFPKIGGRWELRIVIAFFCLTLLYLAMSPLPLSMALQDYRPYLLMITSFIVGNYVGKYTDGFKVIIRFLIYLTVFIIAFAFVEHYIFPETMFRVYFPVVKIATEIKGFSDIEFYIDGLPGNFINSEAGQRMVGPFGDPLYMGYFLIFCLDVLFAYWFFVTRKLNGLFLLLVVGLLCIFLGQVRAVWIGLAASLVVLLFNKRYFKYLVGSVLVIIPLVLVKYELIATTVASMFIGEGQGSASGHILAYFQGIPRLLTHPFGYGVGAAGQFAVRSQTYDTSSLVGVENAYINLALELGIFPALFVLAISYYIVRRSKPYLQRFLSQTTTTERIVLLAGFMLNIQFMIAGFLSPHIMTARIVIPFWILNGACVAILRNLRTR